MLPISDRGRGRNHITDFIEYSDPPLDVGVLRSTIALIQIHGSRLRQLVRDNHDPSKSTVHVIPRASIEARIIDAASVYAGAGAMYRYARQQDEQLPCSLSWDAVRSALRSMQIWDDEYPTLASLLEAREKASSGPFEFLKVSSE
jgi:hypothetical protein